MIFVGKLECGCIVAAWVAGHIQEIPVGEREGLRIEELPPDQEVASVPCDCEQHSRTREKR